jgi:hypothetical protein
VKVRRTRDLDVLVFARHDEDPGTERLNKCGVVGRVI